jgi:hypothetical protein
MSTIHCESISVVCARPCETRELVRPKLPSAYVSTVTTAAGSGRVSFDAIVSTRP